MTEQQEQDCTYPVEKYNSDGNENRLYSFGCGFFRDVIYGLMLLKQRQQLHDNANKFLTKRWSSKCIEEEECKGDDDDDIDNDGVCQSEKEHLTLSLEETATFTQFQKNVLLRHKDLALKDDNLRRMGAFYMTAPQSNAAAHKTKRMKTIASFYNSMRSKRQDKHRIATLSPRFARSSQPSIMDRIRKSMSRRSVRTLPMSPK